MIGSGWQHISDLFIHFWIHYHMIVNCDVINTDRSTVIGEVMGVKHVMSIMKLVPVQYTRS